MLALAVTVAVIQVALILYERNVMISALADGARLGASYGATPAEGAADTRALLRAELGPLGREVRASITSSEQGSVVLLRATGTYQSVLGFPVLRFDLVARMHAEQQLVTGEP